MLLAAASRLWLRGASLDWNGFHGSERRRRVSLPFMPIRPTAFLGPARRIPDRAERLPDKKARLPVDEWFYIPIWKSSLPAADSERNPVPGRVCLLLNRGRAVENCIGSRLAEEGFDVIRVRPGDRFTPGCPDDIGWTIRTPRIMTPFCGPSRILDARRRSSSTAGHWVPRRRTRQAAPRRPQRWTMALLPVVPFPSPGEAWVRPAHATQSRGERHRRDRAGIGVEPPGKRAGVGCLSGDGSDLGELALLMY